jgi:hypothetical protein
MREREIEPFRGLGELTFGTSRDVCRAILGGQFESFARVGGGGAETDSFDALGLQLAFDEQDKLAFVEAFPPADIRYRGVRLLGELSEVTEELTTHGIVGKQDAVGYDFPEHGFGLYAPHEKVEAVSVYRRGYYDTR